MLRSGGRQGAGGKKKNRICNLDSKQLIERLNNNSNIGKTQLSFGEFIQKFRQEHNLKQDGIESEELLEGVRDLSSGSEVIW